MSDVPRYWIPESFHFTRLSQESVEMVRAVDYDSVQAELAKMTEAVTRLTEELTRCRADLRSYKGRY